MSRYTEQRAKDVARIVEFYDDDPNFYTIEELFARAWELGVAYAQGYGVGYPTKEKNSSDPEEFYGDTGKKFL